MEKELSNYMFILTGIQTQWNVKSVMKWVLENTSVKPPKNWIKSVNQMFMKNNMYIRICYVNQLEFCVVYAKP